MNMHCPFLRLALCLPLITVPAFCGTAVGFWPLINGPYSPNKEYIAHEVQNACDIDTLIRKLYFTIYAICTQASRELPWLIEQFAQVVNGNLIYAAAKIGNYHGPVEYQIETGVAQSI